MSVCEALQQGPDRADTETVGQPGPLLVVDLLAGPLFNAFRCVLQARLERSEALQGRGERRNLGVDLCGCLGQLGDETGVGRSDQARDVRRSSCSGHEPLPARDAWIARRLSARRSANSRSMPGTSRSCALAS